MAKRRKKATKKAGKGHGRKKPRTAAQKAATKRMIAANRAKHGHKRTSTKRKGTRKGTRKAPRSLHGRGHHVTRHEFNQYKTHNEHRWQKQAVINTVAVSSIKALYNRTGHAQPGSLAALPVGPSGPAGHRRLGSGR